MTNTKDAKHRRPSGPKAFVVAFVVGFLLLWVGTSVLAQEGDNCQEQNGVQYCEFTKDNSPACHDTRDFPSPQSVADFYGGKVLKATVIPREDGSFEAVTLIEVDSGGKLRRYLFQGIMPALGEDFKNCMVGIATKLEGDPA